MKISIIFGLIVMVTILGWLFFKGPSRIAIQDLTPTPTELVPLGKLGVTPNPSNLTQSTPKQNIVIYNDSGYSPSVLTIKKGDTVVWENKSSSPIWTAANPHPIHSSYSVGGGCIGSAFDECHSDASGTSWTFMFDQVGSWAYHNHLRSRDTGTIIVR